MPFASNPLVAIAYPDHPLAGEKGIAPSRLEREPFIARKQGSGTRLAYEAFFCHFRTERQLRKHRRSAISKLMLLIPRSNSDR